MPDWYTDKSYNTITTVVFDSSFKGSRPTGTQYWFYGMENMTNITGLEYLNTSQVLYMDFMFYGCSSLTTLDLSNFDTSNVTNMSYMFCGCYDLMRIYVGSGWNMSNVHSSCELSMFWDCINLVGERGTSYDPDHSLYGEYAHIDGGTTNPGYLSTVGTPFLGVPYAVKSTDNTTLTFYYDNQKSSRTGTVYRLITAERGEPGWRYDENLKDITTLVFDYSFANFHPTKTSYWFCDMSNLTFIVDISNLNTQNVTKMEGMFECCSGLTTLDLSSFNTSNVTRMGRMFEDCSALTTLDLSGFDTQNVESMSNMFHGCSALRGLDVSHFDTHNVTAMNDMFRDCSTLTSLDVSGFNTSNVTDMRGMFGDCMSLTSLDVSHFDTQNVTDMGNMFINCHRLKSLDVSHFDTNNVTNMVTMFGGCRSLTSLDPSGFNTLEVTDMRGMFSRCESLTTLDLSSFITESVKEMDYMFMNSFNLTTIYVSDGWTTDNVLTGNAIFAGDNNLVGGMGTRHLCNPDSCHCNLNYAHIDGGESNPGYLTGVDFQVERPYVHLSSDGKTLTFYYDDQKNNRQGSRLGSTFNLNNVENDPDWYKDNLYNAVTKVVFDSSFAKAHPRTTRGWFKGMSLLANIVDIQYLNTSEVTSMISMFEGCSGLTSLNLSSFDTSNVTSMISMFMGCSSLQDLNVSSFNTSKVTNMRSMFNECSELTSLDVSGFDTRKVTDMDRMFQGCSSLMQLDLSSFHTALVTWMDYMFEGCSSLYKIIVSNKWDALNSGNDMFKDCTNLVGGWGTTYDASHVGVAYAHIDGGIANPGYLTSLPYVVYDSSNNKLTFYNDGKKYNHSYETRTVYDLNEGENVPGWFSDGSNANITTVVFDKSFAYARPTSMYAWFAGMSNLTEIVDIENLDTRDVTSMGRIFYGCSALTAIDLSHFNTQNLTAIGVNAFNGCTNLQSIVIPEGISVLETNAFSNCASLTTIEIPGSVTEIQGSVFYGCTNLKSVTVNWTTPIAAAANAFPNRTKQILYVPEGTKAAYQSADVWKEFHFILYPGESLDNYAIYNTTTKTLTFYHDDQALTRTGLGYLLNTGDNTPEWSVYKTYATKVVFTTSFAQARPVSTAHWFEGMSSLTTITGLENLNTNEVTTMASMFKGCTKLTSLDLSTFNTAKVTDMSNMFYGCTMLADLNLSGWNTAMVTDMSSMFRTCSNLTTLDLKALNTGNVTSMASMFQSDYRLTMVDMYGLNTEKVTDMSHLFHGCTNLTTVDVGGINTASVTTMANMFNACSQKLKVLDLSSFNTAAVTDMGSMFNSCGNLVAIIAGNGWTVDNVTSSTGMFSGCTKLVGGNGTKYSSSIADKTRARIDAPQQPGYLTGADSAPTPYVVLSSDGKTLTFLCDGQRLTHVNSETTFFLNSGSYPGWIDINGLQTELDNIETVVFDASFSYARPTTCYYWFYNLKKLETITGIENLNTSEVTEMRYMFASCTALTSLDLSSFNTEKVVYFDNMFYGCTSLTSLNLSGFTTQSNGSNVTMSCMFWGCTSLTDLDLTDFDTQYVKDMGSMFNGCSSLEILDLSSFNTAKVTNMNSMFSGCTSLTTIYASDGWNLSAVLNHSNMFKNCTSIVGSMGTTYDADHIDKTYARFDGGQASPGYLSTVAPYAVYDSNTTTLTFYYDRQKKTRPGTTYFMPEIGTKPGWYTDGNNRNIAKVVIDKSFKDVRLTNGYWLFAGLYSLTSFEGIEYLNTSEMTNMNNMFCGIALPTLDLNLFDTSKVTDMAGMFSGASVTSLDLTSFNTQNVTTMNYMFGDCTELTDVNVSSFNTENVGDMGSMFTECTALENLDLSSFNTENVHRLDQMFFDCGNLVSLDLSNFNTQHVSNLNAMFCDCSGLTSLNLSGFNTDGVSDMQGMFGNCSSLTSLDLSSFNTENVTDMGGMFSDCTTLTTLDLSTFNTENVTRMQGMFSGCSDLTTIYVGGGWNVDNLTSGANMFLNCTSLVGGMGTSYDANYVNDLRAHIDGGNEDRGYLTEKLMAYAQVSSDGSTLTFYYDGDKFVHSGTIYDLNEGATRPGWYDDRSYRNIAEVVFDESFANARPTSMYWWFTGMSNLSSIDLSGVNTSKVTNMNSLFYNCGLTSLDLSDFNTMKVTDMNSMFRGCNKLTSLDLSRLITLNVTNMNCMFMSCTALEDLDMSNFNTGSVTDMSNMFYNCLKLETLDLSSFDTKNVTDMDNMFQSCNALTTIFVSNEWNVDAVTSSTDMFTDCQNIVGGRGTVYTGSGYQQDKTYAHIDGGQNNPGYLTSNQPFLLGDVNGDGKVDVADITALTNHFKGTEGSFNEQAADVDGDGQVTSADIPALVGIILGQ